MAWLSVRFTDMGIQNPEQIALNRDIGEEMVVAAKSPQSLNQRVI